MTQDAIDRNLLGVGRFELASTKRPEAMEIGFFPLAGGRQFYFLCNGINLLMERTCPEPLASPRRKIAATKLGKQDYMPLRDDGLDVIDQSQAQ